MLLYFIQSGPSLPPSAGPGVPVVAVFLMMIPACLIIAGTVLGFRALKDIRLAEGRLGGPVLATLAAGLLPAAVILIVCGGGLAMLAEEISPVARRKEDLWITLGVIAGLWFCFLMMRAMHRHATGWMRPACAAANESSRSWLTTAAIVFTILGSAMVLVLLVVPVGRSGLPADFKQLLMLLNLAVLLTGLICGVLARRETAGKVCAGVCGSLFILLVLLVAA